MRLQKIVYLIIICGLYAGTMHSQNNNQANEIFTEKNIHLKTNLLFKKTVALNTTVAIIYIDFNVYEKEYIDYFKRKRVNDYYRKNSLNELDSMRKFFLKQDTIMLSSTRTNELIALKQLEKKQVILINKETSQRVFDIIEREFTYSVNQRLVGEYGKKFYFVLPNKEFLKVIKGHY